MTNRENQLHNEIKKLDKKENNFSVKGSSNDEKVQKKKTKLKKEKFSHNFLNKSFDKKINFFKHFIFKDHLENLLDLSGEENHCNQHGNTIFNISSKNYIKKAPRHKTLINNEYMSPFKLNSNKENTDYRINKVDSKSTDDKNELYEYNGSDDEENFQKFKNFGVGFYKYLRKKMMEFLTSYNFKKLNEFENILNIENIFRKSDIMILKPNSRKNIRKKKCNFWHKHILEQNKRLSLNIYLNKDNIFNIRNNKKPGTINIKRNNEGLFILGVLECAALDKKRRKSDVNVKIEIVDNNDNK